MTASWPGRKVDVWATIPMPRAGTTTALIDGNSEKVLSITQILRGKLERGEDCLPRDVVDVVCAEQMDRKNLVAAANAAGRSWTTIIAGIWQAASEHIAARATMLDTCLPRSEIAQLGKAGAAALRNVVYRELEIGVDRERILIHGTTSRGKEPPLVIDRKWDEGFERWGLNDYLRGRGPGPGLIRTQAEQAARKKSGYQQVYSERDGAMTFWAGGNPKAPPTRPTEGRGTQTQQRSEQSKWERE